MRLFAKKAATTASDIIRNIRTILVKIREKTMKGFTGMIPKVIHYCWFGGNPLPRSARECIRSWHTLCPDYTIKRWDESNFDVRQSPFMRAAYEQKAWAFVSDWARLKIVCDEGGIYLDTDVKLLKNLDSLLTNDCYVGVQQVERLCNTGLGFGAIKGSRAVKLMLSEYDSLTFRVADEKKLACPRFNDHAVRQLGYTGNGDGDPVKLDDVTVYPCRYFDPIAPGDFPDLTSEDTMSVSLYANSWGTKTERLRREIITFVGVERISALKKKLGRRK